MRYGVVVGDAVGKLSLVKSCSLLNNPLVFLLWHFLPKIMFPTAQRLLWFEVCFESCKANS